MVLTLQSVHEMLMCDSSDVIERKCSRWDETNSEIIYTVFRLRQQGIFNTLHSRLSEEQLNLCENKTRKIK